VIREHDPEAHVSRAAQFGLAKLRAYSTTIREIPVYIAAVVLDPRQKWDYFDLGIEQADWTIREVQAAKETVQQLWEDQDRVTTGSYLPSRDDTSAMGNAEPGSLGLVEEEEQHHRHWQAKRRRVTPGQYHNLILSINIPYYIVFLIHLACDPQMMPIQDISNHLLNQISIHLSTIGSIAQSLQIHLLRWPSISFPYPQCPPIRSDYFPVSNTFLKTLATGLRVPVTLWRP